MVPPLPLGTKSKVLNFSTTLFLGIAPQKNALVEKRLYIIDASIWFRERIV